MSELPESVCRVVGHAWPEVVSGEAGRPDCARCGMDYVEYLVKALGAEKAIRGI